MTLQVLGRCVELRDDGFLVSPEDWNDQVAAALAASISLVITEAHWEIIHFIRAYHSRFQHLPNNRLFVKAIEKEFGPAKGNSRYLNGLFQGSPVRNACLIAGLPKPPGCI